MSFTVVHVVGEASDHLGRLKSSPAQPSAVLHHLFWDYAIVFILHRDSAVELNGGHSFTPASFQNLTYWTKVGTRYFFLSPLPLVRYLEMVLPLRAGPLFSKIW
jgi:hypothetical protein